MVRRSDLSGKTILVVEDEEYNYLYIEHVLKKLQANVLHAENGLEAVNLCKKTRVDIIIMDIKMPVLDGIKASKEIIELNKNIPIIIQSAIIDDDLMNKVDEIGISEYIRKPFSKDKLLAALWKYIK